MIAKRNSTNAKMYTTGEYLQYQASFNQSHGTQSTTINSTVYIIDFPEYITLSSLYRIYRSFLGILSIFIQKVVCHLNI